MHPNFAGHGVYTYEIYRNLQWMLVGWKLPLSAQGTLTSSLFSPSSSPTLASFRKDGRTGEGIFFSSYDGTGWTPAAQVQSVATSTSPTLASFNGKLYMAWKGSGRDPKIWWSLYPRSVPTA